jgi:hypothetical protein
MTVAGVGGMDLSCAPPLSSVTDAAGKPTERGGDYDLPFRGSTVNTRIMKAWNSDM